MSSICVTGTRWYLRPRLSAARPPQIDAEAVDRTVGLDMAVSRHVVDRDLERRVLSHGETGEDEVNERGREGPNESRGGQKAREVRC